MIRIGKFINNKNEFKLRRVYLMDELINKLKTFCKSDFQYVIDNDTVRIFDISGAFYQYNIRECSLEYSERGNISVIGSWNDRRIGDYYFASQIKSALGKGINYGCCDEFEEAKSFEVLNRLIKNKFDESLYSIGTIEDKKISIVNENSLYRIVYLYKNSEYEIESSHDKDFIFGRFLYEIEAYEYYKKNIADYSKVFDIDFTEDEICSLLGYK